MLIQVHMSIDYKKNQKKKRQYNYYLNKESRRLDHIDEIIIWKRNQKEEEGREKEKYLCEKKEEMLVEKEGQ